MKCSENFYQSLEKKIYREPEEKNNDPDFLVTKTEKEIKKIYFKTHELVKLYQESYFSYDRSNLVRQSFVNKRKKILPIYCLASFLREKITEKIALLYDTKSKSFFEEKNAKKEELNLQIANISGERADTTDTKIREAFITRISKKRTKKIDAENFKIIRGQPGFEADKAINPIETKIENDRIQNIFSSSIKKYAENIFLATNRPAVAKYGLINDQLYQIIGFIELSEMEKGDEIKKCSRWFNVNFQTQRENRQTKYFSYDFQTKNKGDLLNFTLKLVDSNIKYIAFADGDKKYPTLNFIIEFLA